MFHRQEHIDAAAAKGLEIADLLAVVVDDPHLPAHFTAKGPALSGGDLVDLSGVSRPPGGKHLGRLGIGAVGGRGRGKGHTGLLSAYRLRRGEGRWSGFNRDDSAHGADATRADCR